MSEPFIAHEKASATHEKDPPEELKQWQVKQRLKQYKKRLGRHEQKRLAQERTGKKVARRTIEAIENNRQWVKHYESLLSEKI